MHFEFDPHCDCCQCLVHLVFDFLCDCDVSVALTSCLIFNAIVMVVSRAL